MEYPRPVSEPMFTCLALGATKMYVGLYTGENVRIALRDIVTITNAELPVARSVQFEVTKVTRYKTCEELVNGESMKRLQPFPELSDPARIDEAVKSIRQMHKIKATDEARWGLVAIRLAEPKQRDRGDGKK